MKYLQALILILVVSNASAEVVLVNKNKQHEMSVSYYFCWDHLGRAICTAKNTVMLASKNENDKNNIYIIKTIPEDMTWIEIASVTEKDVSGNVVAKTKYSVGYENLCRIDVVRTDNNYHTYTNNAVFAFNSIEDVPVVLCSSYGYV